MTSPVIMLTLNDKTLSDASPVFEQIRQSKISCFGFKDIGLPWDQMEKLAQEIRGAGKTLFFEIVSSSLEETLQGAQRALRLKADYLIGGKFVKQVLPVVKNQKIKYFPYVGDIVGHPCCLEGAVEEMLNEALEYAQWGVDGINLLAYRHSSMAQELIQYITEECSLPLLVAGSVNSQDQISFLEKYNVEFFTMGSALFQKELVTDASLKEQVAALESFCGLVNGSSKSV